MDVELIDWLVFLSLVVYLLLAVEGLIALINRWRISGMKIPYTCDEKPTENRDRIADWIHKGGNWR